MITGKHGRKNQAIGSEKIGTSISKFHHIHQDSSPHSLTLFDCYVSEFIIKYQCIYPTYF